MKTEIFRTAQFWKAAFISMPDNSFFELMRSVFGKIKTPFNKQQLLNDLESFLLRSDIQETIGAYIDYTDAKIITAVALFGEPTPRQLENFFCDEHSNMELQDIIINLEERFILYRAHCDNNENSRLALNPILKQVLLPFTTQTSTLFPAAPENKKTSAQRAPKTQSAPIINDLTLAALFSFICTWDTFYKSENVIRKKVIDEGKTLFPALDLADITGALQILGLFYAHDERLLPDKKRFEEFASLSARERSQYLAAAFMLYGELSPPFEILPPLFKNKIKDIAYLIHNFLNLLKPDSAYLGQTLKRMMEVTKAQTGVASQININANSALLLDALAKTGILQTENHLTRLVRFSDEKKNAPVIAIDSGGSVIVYPEIDFNDAIKLASFLNIRETSSQNTAPVLRFELDKDSAVRAFNNNIGADEIIDLLKKLAGEKAQYDTLTWNLKDWEKRHKEVSLKKGVVLQLSQEHSYIVETKPLADLIMETLAPGVYLLNENAMPDAQEALKKAGIDIIAQRNISRSEKKDGSIASLGCYPSFPSHASQENNLASPASMPEEGDFSRSSGYEEMTNSFRAMLEKINLNETEKTELGARIDRKLVLCENQLKNAYIRYEKLEARHMDYAGKQNIVKQAIAQQSPVEVVWSMKGKEKKNYGIPKALEKNGGDLTLVIEDERIPIAKISLLRRVKKSIFEK
ncbi:MAG: hypothetical protein FWC01_06215 [Treponema sp.]|nr:hypothetical protein [Treponema sp.]MCL2237458.1 hypothetical protein [Treponema sp.]